MEQEKRGSDGGIQPITTYIVDSYRARSDLLLPRLLASFLPLPPVSERYHSAVSSPAVGLRLFGSPGQDA